MKTIDVVNATAVPILELGRGWIVSGPTIERGEALGLQGQFAFWVNGRAGVLGEVDSDVAAAAIGFMHGPMVRGYWESRPPGLPPIQAATAYAEAAAVWGRGVLAGIDEAALFELHGLARRVAEAADPSLGVLFAGWRALDAPSDAAGAATISLNVLREMRGGAHLSAVQALGLGPLGAIVAADDPIRGGTAGAERFGWPPPFPEPQPDSRREADVITSRICEPAYSVLSETERSRFSDLVAMARAAMD